MSVLLMRCFGMQSWGLHGSFDIRDTCDVPTHSGVIGLLLAAKGVPRDEIQNYPDILNLSVAVRVNQQGRLSVDFQTAKGVLSLNQKESDKSKITYRYYLCDADFLVAVEGDYQLLKSLHEDLRSPMFPIYFGRKAFIPSMPVWVKDGLRKDGNAIDVLTDEPFEVMPGMEAPRQVRINHEVRFEEEGRIRLDNSRGFINTIRTFSPRKHRDIYVKCPPVVGFKCAYFPERHHTNVFD